MYTGFPKDPIGKDGKVSLLFKFHFSFKSSTEKVFISCFIVEYINSSTPSTIKLIVGKTQLLNEISGIF